MKGAGALIVAIVVVLLLRSTALTAFAARGVVLDALAFATVLWALRHGASWGATFGFALGLFADLDAAHWLGRHALALTLLGYAVGRLASILVRESSRTQFVLVLLATAAHQTWSVAFELANGPAWPAIVARVLFASFATAALGTAILWVARRATGQPLFGNVSIQPGRTW
jgi:rod shape-determining protein MreD